MSDCNGTGYEVKFTHILDDEDWAEKVMNSEMLSLVEVYSSWCGPCTISWPNILELEKQCGLLFITFNLEQK